MCYLEPDPTLSLSLLSPLSPFLPSLHFSSLFSLSLSLSALSLCLRLSSYLLDRVHSKVFPTLCRVHKRQNNDLVERFRHLRDALTPNTVGVSEDYNCPYNQTLLHLDRLEECKAPLEQLYCLQDAMVLAFFVSCKQRKN